MFDVISDDDWQRYVHQRRRELRREHRDYYRRNPRLTYRDS